MTMDLISNSTGGDGGRALQPVVFARSGAVFANSRDVAAFFEKRHDHVLRDIDALISQIVGLPSFGETLGRGDGLLNFEEAPYIEPSNGQTYRSFDMTRDGFMLLAMGFTGARALHWKIQYIRAFNQMEAAMLGAEAPQRPRLRGSAAAAEDMRDLLSACREVRRTYGRVAARDFWEGSDLVQLYDPADASAIEQEAPIAMFVREKCVVTGQSSDFTPSRDLISAMLAFLAERQLPPLGRRTVSMQLRDQAAACRAADGPKFWPAKVSDTGYRGIRLR